MKIIFVNRGEEILIFFIFKIFEEDFFFLLIILENKFNLYIRMMFK